MGPDDKDDNDGKDDNDDGEVPAGAPPRRKTWATSLASAAPGQVIYVDQSGSVQPESVYREDVLLWSAWPLVAAVLALPLWTAMFGAPGVLGGFVLAAWAMWRIAARMSLARAARVHAKGDADKARRMLGRLAHSHLHGRAVRAHACIMLARLAMTSGDHAAALGHYQTLRQIVPGFPHWGGSGYRAALGEVLALVNCDRLPEARARFTALGATPAGDFVRYWHWTDELYLCLAEGKHAIPADHLHLRARTGLQITGGSALIALCAWAHAQIGDHEQAAHLLAEARERGTEALQVYMPKLHAWLLTQP